MTIDKTSFELDLEKTCTTIETFTKELVASSKTAGIVVGLSGGIDSAVTAALCVRAIGKEKVLGIIMPSAKLDPSYEKDARELAKQLGIKVEKVSIAKMVEAFNGSVSKNVAADRLALANTMARFRMVVLYAYSNHLNYLVVGTSNKSEIMVGYYTKYGDGGVDFEPCGELYKTQIRELAKYLKIPEAIITKPPSAGLWEGQTDEGEMGITYENLDLILLALENNYSPKEIQKELGLEVKLVEKVQQMIAKTEHKRKMPPICYLN